MGILLLCIIAKHLDSLLQNWRNLVLTLYLTAFTLALIVVLRLDLAEQLAEQLAEHLERETFQVCGSSSRK